MNVSPGATASSLRNASTPSMPSSPTVAASTVVPSDRVVVIDATPPLRKYTARSGSPLLWSTRFTRIGTVFRYGRMRPRSSAGRAASNRFLGRRFGNGGRSARDVRADDWLFLGMVHSRIGSACRFGEIVASTPVGGRPGRLRKTTGGVV